MNKTIIFAGSLMLASSQAMAFGGMFQGMLENVVKDTASNAATTAAKSVAQQQGIQGADQMIDGAAGVARSGVPQAISAGGGNAGLSALAASDIARAQSQANTPIPASQLRQYPASTTDLNRDGIVTFGEVQQVQRRGLPVVQNGQWSTYPGAAPATAAIPQQAGNAAGAALGNALGGMIGGLFGSGGNATPSNDTNTEEFGDY